VGVDTTTTSTGQKGNGWQRNAKADADRNKFSNSELGYLRLYNNRVHARVDSRQVPQREIRDARGVDLVGTS
jgi:hypothetical protein